MLMGRITLMFKFDDAIRGGVFHPISEDNATVRHSVPPKLSAHARPVEDIVSEDETHGLIANVFFPQDEGLGNSCW